MKYIASVSFGKDSLAMLLMLLEKNIKVDEVIFYDTGMEFQAIYDIREKVKIILKYRNIVYTELKPKVSFVYKMLEKPVQKRDKTTQCGYGICGGRCRWGTSDKNLIINKYLKNKYENNYREYIGIAYDEKKRIIKERTIHKILPLVEWQMTEKDCLEYCYKNGFYWEENNIRLYDALKRVSCWCCANKNKKELDNMFYYLPHYYLKIIGLLKQIKKNNDKNSIVVKKAEEFYLKML